MCCAKNAKLVMRQMNEMMNEMMDQMTDLRDMTMGWLPLVGSLKL